MRHPPPQIREPSGARVDVVIWCRPAWTRPAEKCPQRPVRPGRHRPSTRAAARQTSPSKSRTPELGAHHPRHPAGFRCYVVRAGRPGLGDLRCTDDSSRGGTPPVSPWASPAPSCSGRWAPAERRTPGATTDPTSATTTATADDSASGEPEVDPATGPVIQAEHFRVNLPQGFRRSPATSTILESAYASDGDPAQITVSHLANIGGSSLAGIAKTYRHTEGRALVRQDDAQLGGQPALHLAGAVGGQRVEVYALVRDGEAVELRFMLTTDRGARPRRTS